MADASLIPHVHRSRFVTGLAWTFIVMAGLSLLGSILQYMMMSAMLSDDSFALASAVGSGQLPAAAAYFLDNVRVFALLSLLTSAGILISAIGLLRRREWARVTFIVILSLSIASGVAVIALQYAVLSRSGILIPDASFEVQGMVDQMVPGIMFATGLMFAVHTAVGVWLILRLNSASIKEEFSAAH
jgi:hypothetical protein